MDAVSQMHEKLGIPRESEDRTQGRATYVARERALTLAGRSMSSLIDCGHTNTTSAGAILNTVIEATARNPGLSSAAVSCRSRGTFEQMISERVRALLQPRD